jgi:hypothetical protein
VLLQVLQVLRTRRAKGGQSFRRTATREEPSMRSPRFSSLVVRSRTDRSIAPVFHAGGPHRTTSKISSMRLYGLASVGARPHVLDACKDDCLADGQCSLFYSRKKGLPVLQLMSPLSCSYSCRESELAFQ